jgi:hypothetical protein
MLLEFENSLEARFWNSVASLWVVGYITANGLNPLNEYGVFFGLRLNMGIFFLCG